MEYAKYENGKIEFFKKKEKLIFENGAWTRTPKTEGDILAEGFKPYTVEEKPIYNKDTHYLKTSYVDNGVSVNLVYELTAYTAEELEQIATSYAEELLKNKASWFLPRFEFFNGLLNASAIRFGELPTKSMLIDYVKTSPDEAYRMAAMTAGVEFTPEFVSLARESAIIDIEESSEFTRYNPTILGMITSIGRPAKDEEGNILLNDFGLPILVDKFSDKDIDNWFRYKDWTVLLLNIGGQESISSEAIQNSMGEF